MNPRNSRFTPRISLGRLSSYDLAILTWKLRGTTRNAGPTSDQDTTAMTQDQNGRPDTGLAECGNIVCKALACELLYYRQFFSHTVFLI